MIKHVLSDGRVLKDISGHKVTKEGLPEIFTILERRRAKSELRRIKKSK